MNYYIQGNKENAEKIKAAFMEKGLIVCGHNFDDKSYLYFTYNLEGGGKVISSTNINLITANLIKRLAELGDYTELELPVEPKFKFKVGDWIVGNEGIFKITQYEEEYGYYLTDTTGRVAHFVSPDYVESNFHLWTVQDAKSGDVLACSDWLFILKQFNVKGNKHKTYCHYDLTLKRFKDDNDSYMVTGSDEFHPATKEQRDLLFQKMKEAGYEWDADKKELKKIQPHYDISNFHAGMPVLVRADNNCRWDYSVFSRITGNESWQFAVCNGVSFTQCIPFEGNEHLLGTSDPCDEQYINW